ncbi:cilia- and flagella-associated protein 45 isoform X1 [Synchiropus splendidus]|uniref:cilia- and flagella-associated protein 45 isoform X1 n=1 Tax=Synchiropus splendidus TaxID=270530 RepID=UPI00237DD762|nr:cilia- and flagella-associated protein 45 isoform X1 [Synchiropus splendidus]XP_053729790.1 cilia- and flagella-associated protein 45 isoform X1 [Synchiropus splendidus]
MKRAEVSNAQLSSSGWNDWDEDALKCNVQRGGQTRRASGFHRRATRSHVDETLFGRPASSAPGADAETLQIITRDLVRTLRVRRRDLAGESISLASTQLQKICSTSGDAATEEGNALQWRREEGMRAAEERRRQLQEADESRGERQAPTEVELQAQARATRLLERANHLRLEQEEEVKELNKLILGAQCQATRDAQIQEKKVIQQEMTEEEKRLDAMMEVERRKAVEAVEQIEELRRQQRVNGMQQICSQIQERLEEKQMEEMSKEQERLQIREKQERMNLEDLKNNAVSHKALEKKREEQRLLHQEVMRINAEAIQAKEQRREEEKLADMREMDYIKKKLEREAEYDAEQRRIKKDKELEIARLRAQQQRARDYKAEQDELRARRNQEAADREWRKKEKELALRKAQEEEKLRAARVEQVHCKEHFLSMEAEREKAEFERLLKVQQEMLARKKVEEGKQRESMQKHAEAIRQQVKEVEAQAVRKRMEIFKEGQRLNQEASRKREHLNEVKERKLQELRETGLPERYCSQVQRKARAQMS